MLRERRPLAAQGEKADPRWSPPFLDPDALLGPAVPDIHVTDLFARRSASVESAFNAERSLSSVFACTSGRAAPAAERLAALPARVRALINGRRLDDALVQLARIDAGAELRSAVHTARAMYQRRIAAIQRELRKDHADLIRSQLAAPRLVALVDGLQFSSGGQVPSHLYARLPEGCKQGVTTGLTSMGFCTCSTGKDSVRTVGGRLIAAPYAGLALKALDCYQR